MAHTHSSLLVHCVFSTKDRKKLIHIDWEERLWSYLGGILKELECPPIAVGGVENHVHLLFSYPPKLALSDVMKLVKGNSSKWVSEMKFSPFKFQWQDGYGVFSVSESKRSEVIQYVQNQREHHRIKPFEEEYRAFLDRHGVQFDERFVYG